MTVKKVFVNNTVFDVEGTGYDPIGNILSSGKVVDFNKNDELLTISKISTLVNDAKLIKEDNLYKIIGDPTEGALLYFLSEK